MASSIRRKAVPVSWMNVDITDGFWKIKQDINREITLPIEYKQCKTTGRIDSFKLKEYKKGKGNYPHQFHDSDVAKWIEAAAYSLGKHPDSALRKKVDYVISLIEKAQQPDGYLNTHFTLIQPENRWNNLRDMHELYTAGHMMEAAVAWYEATGNCNLLDVMCRFADYIDKVFGRKKGQLRGYPGHEEIELALVKLYRATGEERYLKLSKYFVDERGRRPYYFDIEREKRGDVDKYWLGTYDYLQAHIPVREQKTAEGHSVRACYLYAGMADVASETGDQQLLNACKTIWDNIVSQRMYVTGGIGSTRHGERFTFDYDLPNEEAYAETCAAISLAFFSHRMLQATGDGRYADVMERALYNGVISGVSLKGDRFFYENPLAVYPQATKYNKWTRGTGQVERQEWFGCACCPPNIARLIASVGEYIWMVGKDSVYVNLFASNRTSVEIKGTEVGLEMKTEYPWEEKVSLRVNPASPEVFTAALRIPDWCTGPLLKVNGKSVSLKKIMKKGYAHIKREWKKGDRIELILPMKPERVYAHPSVRQDTGRTALQRGPVLYCIEEADNGKNLNSIILPDTVKLSVKKGSGIFNGIPLISAEGKKIDQKDWKKTLYRSVKPETIPVSLLAVPYFMWANRKPGEMITWIRNC